MNWVSALVIIVILLVCKLPYQDFSSQGVLGFTWCCEKILYSQNIFWYINLFLNDQIILDKTMLILFSYYFICAYIMCALYWCVDDVCKMCKVRCYPEWKCPKLSLVKLSLWGCYSFLFNSVWATLRWCSEDESVQN